MGSTQERLRVEPGRTVRLADVDPSDRLGVGAREAAISQLTAITVRLQALHDRLYAEGRRSLLLVLQGMDTSGKDGVIRRVLTGVNPQSCRVTAFKPPAGAELGHDYLWRVHAACPERGHLGIFNRSHYEDIVAVRVRKLAPAAVWKRRSRHIREFERQLTDEGTTILKVFLHISKDEQRKRLQGRLDDPSKTWKFREADLDDRKLWDDFQRAYEDVFAETSTQQAPWFIVPADHRSSRDVAVASLLVEALEALDPHAPPPAHDLAGLKVV